MSQSNEFTSTSFAIREAIPSDLPSLGTIHARAFHPKNLVHRRALPDTTLSRNWWSQRYSEDIGIQPACYVIVGAQDGHPSRDTTLAKHETASVDDTFHDRPVVGVLCLRRIAAGEKGAGRWSKLAPCSDFDPVFYNAVNDSMRVYREKLMMDREHLLVEHFGVDGSLQGSGVGGRILQRMCEIADREGLDAFVEANGNAAPFYERYGFRRHGQEVFDGDYIEVFMVRLAQKDSVS